MAKIWLRNIGVSAIVVCVIGSVDAASISEFVNDPNLLAREVGQAERRLVNITADIEVWSESRANASSTWEKTENDPSLSTTVWMNGLPNSKIRVDIRGEKGIWQKDSGNAVLVRDYALSYDGEYGRKYVSKRALDGEVTYPKEGTVLSSFPGMLDTENIRIATGQRFSMHYFFSDNDSYDSFSGFLEADAEWKRQGKAGYDISAESFQGSECIRISSPPSGSISDSFWLDPNRGFSLIGYERKQTKTDGFEWLVSQIIVTKITEVAAGVWFPIEATLLCGPSAPGERYRRTIYRATGVQANVPDLDEGIYNVQFPPDAHVTNAVGK